MPPRHESVDRNIWVVAHLSLLLHGSLGHPKVTRTVIKKGGWMEWSKKTSNHRPLIVQSGLS